MMRSCLQTTVKCASYALPINMWADEYRGWAYLLELSYSLRAIFSDFPNFYKRCGGWNPAAVDAEVMIQSNDNFDDKDAITYTYLSAL